MITVGESVPPAIASYFEALNGEDWDAMNALWRPDASLSAVGAPERVGRESVMAGYRTMFQPWLRHLDTAQRSLGEGNAFAVEVAFSGTTSAGVEVTFGAVDVFDLQEGGIARLTTWFDIGVLRKVFAPPR